MSRKTPWQCKRSCSASACMGLSSRCRQLLAGAAAGSRLTISRSSKSHQDSIALAGSNSCFSASEARGVEGDPEGKLLRRMCAAFRLASDVKCGCQHLHGFCVVCRQYG